MIMYKMAFVYLEFIFHAERKEQKYYIGPKTNIV